MVPGQRPAMGMVLMAVLIVAFGFYVLYPLSLILINSFNIAAIEQPAHYSLENWRVAFTDRAIFGALFNTLIVYFFYTSISFPIAIVTAWLLARTKMPFSHWLEFAFWISWMLPVVAVVNGWVILLDGDVGLINVLFRRLGFVDRAVFDVFSVRGIVFVHLMSNAISLKVMLLTPAFRNMDAALEEAAAVSGGSKLFTMTRVTVPLMAPVIATVLLLNTVWMFQSFEIERVLGTPIRFFVVSTLIYENMTGTGYATVGTEELQRTLEGQATALGSVAIVLIAVIVPLQRWWLRRRRYATVTGQFRPGLISLGALQPVAFAAAALLAAALTVVPIVTLVVGSFMTRVGFFEADPMFTTRHYLLVLNYPTIHQAVRNTLILGVTAAIVAPMLFSVVAYILVLTRWPGRGWLDLIIWSSAAIPGMLVGLGLMWMFLGVPFLVPIYGTIYALILVIIMQGQLLSTQIMKATFLQIGTEMGEAARVSGAGAVRTYLRIWLPLIAPTLVMIGVFQFVIAVGSASSIILLSSRESSPVSIVILEYLRNDTGARYELAGILSLLLVVLTIGVAIIGRRFGLGMGVRHYY